MRPLECTCPQAARDRKQEAMRAVARILTLSLGIGLAGCGGLSAPSDTLVYGRGGEADTLDPIHTSTGETVKVLVPLSLNETVKLSGVA